MEDTRILEQELVTNERLVTHSHYGRVRIRRPTPAMEASIAEQRRRVYHSDLKNKEILTKKEVENLLMERGVWSKEDNERMRELTLQSGEYVARLTALGFTSPTDLYGAIAEQSNALTAAFMDSDIEVREAIGRIFDLDSVLSVKDVKLLRDASTSTATDELIDAAHTSRVLADLLKEFTDVKMELNGMLESYARFFGDTIEARAERSERLATIYHCCTSDSGAPLWKDIEQMRNDLPENIAWLSAQLYYFENGLDQDHIDVLVQYGFMERVIDTGNSSVSSPDHPMSNSDGEPQESAETVSSE